jgi:hypothetical protein
LFIKKKDRKYFEIDAQRNQWRHNHKLNVAWYILIIFSFYVFSQNRKIEIFPDEKSLRFGDCKLIIQYTIFIWIGMQWNEMPLIILNSIFFTTPYAIVSGKKWRAVFSVRI